MPLSRIPLSDYLEAAVTAAHAAASVLQSYASRRNELIIDTKMRNDLVSQADREAEQACVALLQERCPDIGIIAEEGGEQRKELANWIIDPLDGTTNFLHGIPHYAVSIALVAPAGTVLDQTTLSEDTPIIGVVYDPCRNELFTAVYGLGAWLNGSRIQCSASQQLADSLLATGLPFRDFSFSDQYMPGLEQALLQTRGIRRLGAAALDLAWVACGRFDGYWEMGLAPWDVAAGTLLVREAQGICADLYERDPWPSKGYLYAANTALAPHLHGMLKPYLQQKS